MRPGFQQPGPFMGMGPMNPQMMMPPQGMNPAMLNMQNPSAQSGPRPPVSRGLFVTGLEPFIKKEDIQLFFIENGAQAESIFLPKNRTNPNQNRGIAFVYFPSENDAHEARIKTNHKQIKNQQKKVQVYPCINYSTIDKKANVFISNIDTTLTPQEIEEAIQGQFGNVVSIKLSLDKTGQLAGYGYVQFGDIKNAERFLQEGNEFRIGEKTLEVKEFKSSKERQEERLKDARNLFVRNIPDLGDEAQVKQRVEELFGQYGKISSSCFKKVGQAGKYCAFVCFDTHESAENALQVNGLKIRQEDDEPLIVTWQTKGSQKESNGVFMNVNLTSVYMKNLRPDVTQQEVEKAVTESYGPILYCKFGEDKFFGKGKYAILDFMKFESAQQMVQSAPSQAIKKLFNNELVSVQFYITDKQKIVGTKNINSGNVPFNFRQKRQPNFMGMPFGMNPMMMQNPLQLQQMQMFMAQQAPMMNPGFQNQQRMYMGGPQQPRGPMQQRNQFLNNRQEMGAPTQNPMNRMGGHQQQQGKRMPQSGMMGMQGMTGMPGQGMPGQGMPGQGMPGQGMPGQGMPGMQQQRMPQQGMPPAGVPQGPGGMNLPMGRQMQQQPGQGPQPAQQIPQRQGIPPSQPQAIPQLQLPPIDKISQLDDQKKREVLGNILFPKVSKSVITQNKDQKHTPKITGMLLDFEVMDLQEIYELIQDEKQLDERVLEAIELIEQS